MIFVSIHSRDPCFKIMLWYVACRLPYNYYFGPGSCLNTQLNYSLPRVWQSRMFPGRRRSHKPPIYLVLHHKGNNAFLYPNTHYEIKFRQLPLIKHPYHIEGPTKTRLPHQNYKLHRPWFFLFSNFPFCCFCCCFSLPVKLALPLPRCPF